VAKKAETLYLNLEDMIRRNGIEKIGFFTMTFAENLTDRKEAQRRFNNYASNVLRKSVLEYVSAVERQKRGAIHYHLCVVFPFDIRTGFDFDAASKASEAKRVGDFAALRYWQGVYYRSANSSLAGIWREVREVAPKYGFGRCETLPVLSNSAAVCRYIGSYVSSEFLGRSARDYGLRTIRYGLRSRAASIRWMWVNGAGREWRKGCQALGMFLGLNDAYEIERTPGGSVVRLGPQHLETRLGNRWQFSTRKAVSMLARRFDESCMLAASIPAGTSYERRVHYLVKILELMERADKGTLPE